VRPKSHAIVVTLPMQSDSGRAVSAVNFVLIIYDANELRKERWPDDQCGAQEASLSLLYRGEGFNPMKVLSNRRPICETCGHITFPSDARFRCPCPKCLEGDFSPRIRRLRRRLDWSFIAYFRAPARQHRRFGSMRLWVPARIPRRTKCCQK
jgi:hypothetical protein